MEKECFSLPEFLEAMKTRCVLVVADFPQKTEQAPALKEQNKKLADQFKKRGGMPAYYMIDADAKTVHWSWGAHPKYGKDLNLLVSDIDGFVAGCACVVERVAAKLPADEAAAYRKAAQAYADKQKEVAAWIEGPRPDPEAARKHFAGQVEELRKLREAMNALAAASPSASG
jgi:hypothetical protein